MAREALYRSAVLSGGSKHLGLRTSAHIQALLNPPSPDSWSGYRVTEELPPDAGLLRAGDGLRPGHGSPRGVSDACVPTLAAVAVVRRGLVLTGRTRAERCFTADCSCAFAQDYARSFPSDRIRLTSIYSKQDGVVRWERCVVPEAECVEVTGSHVGLAVNRKAYHAIAQAPARPELEG